MFAVATQIIVLSVSLWTCAQMEWSLLLPVESLIDIPEFIL